MTSSGSTTLRRLESDDGGGGSSSSSRSRQTTTYILVLFLVLLFLAYSASTPNGTLQTTLFLNFYQIHICMLCVRRACVCQRVSSPVVRLYAANTIADHCTIVIAQQDIVARESYRKIRLSSICLFRVCLEWSCAQHLALSCQMKCASCNIIQQPL